MWRSRMWFNLFPCLSLYACITSKREKEEHNGFERKPRAPAMAPFPIAFVRGHCGPARRRRRLGAASQQASSSAPRRADHESFRFRPAVRPAVSPHLVGLLVLQLYGGSSGWVKVTFEIAGGRVRPSHIHSGVRLIGLSHNRNRYIYIVSIRFKWIDYVRNSDGLNFWD